MRQLSGDGFMPQFLALLFAGLIIHTIFTLWIRPQAEAEIAVAEELNEAPPRSVAIVLKDFEQEACFILLIWATGIIGIKAHQLSGQSHLVAINYFDLEPGVMILPGDTKHYVRNLQTLPEEQRDGLLPKMMLASLQRFGSTGDIRSASEAARSMSEAEGERLESELSMVRYIAWAIPSIGFIGTVRGIGDALSSADEAVKGNIAGVTESLGVAFNSTFVALMLSIFLMFLLHQLQLRQDRHVLGADEFCERDLLSRFKSFEESPN